MLGEGGQEEEIGWQAATRLGLNDTCLTASLLVRQETRFPICNVAILSKPFQNSRLCWGVLLLVLPRV